MKKLSKNSMFIMICVLSTYSSNIFGEEYTFDWVDYYGRQVKKWNITNERFFVRTINKTENVEIENSHSGDKEILTNDKQDVVGFKQDKIVKSKKQSLLLGLSLSRISLNSIELAAASNEIAVSDIGYGVNVRWSLLWSKKYELFFDGTLSRYSFSVAQGKTITESKLIKTYFGIGAKYNYNENHQYSVGLGVGDSFILLGKNQTELEIDKASIPALSFSGAHGIKTFESGLKLGVNWRTGLLAPATESNYSTELGNFWNIGIHSRLKNNINIGISYGQRSLDTESLEQVSKGLNISCGVIFNY